MEWLEDYVSHFKGTVLTISHDRYFLDRCVDRIIALNEGKAEFYSGNYSFYVVERERRYQERLKQYEKEQAKIAQLTQAADQMHLWAFMGNDKLHKRAFSMEKRIEKMRTTDKPRQERNLTMGFQSTDFKGDMLFTLEGCPSPTGITPCFPTWSWRCWGRAHRPVGGQRHGKIHPAENFAEAGKARCRRGPVRPHRQGGLPAPRSSSLNTRSATWWTP